MEVDSDETDTPNEFASTAMDSDSSSVMEFTIEEDVRPVSPAGHPRRINALANTNEPRALVPTEVREEAISWPNAGPSPFARPSFAVVNDLEEPANNSSAHERDENPNGM